MLVKWNGEFFLPNAVRRHLFLLCEQTLVKSSPDAVCNASRLAIWSYSQSNSLRCWETRINWLFKWAPEKLDRFEKQVFRMIHFSHLPLTRPFRYPKVYVVTLPLLDLDNNYDISVDDNWKYFASLCLPFICYLIWCFRHH